MKYSRLSAALKIFIALQMTMAPLAARAANVQLKSDVIVRTHHADLNEMVRVGELKAGSVLSIPDRFVVKKNNRIDAELTLNNWLKQAGSLVDINGKAGQYAYNRNSKEYFFPVKIKKAAEGSTLVEGFGQQEVFVALSRMARQNKVLFLDNDVEIVSTMMSYEKPYTEAVVECDGCKRSPPNAAENLISALALPLKQAIAATQNKTKNYEGNKSDILANFANKCDGVSYRDFKQAMVIETNNDPIKMSLLESLIVNESAGENLCKAHNSNDKGAGSWGLFQINGASAEHQSCKIVARAEKELTKAGLTKLINADAKAKKEKQEPATTNTAKQKEYIQAYADCRAYLENPYNNLREAIRILKQKETFLFSGKSPLFQNSESIPLSDRIRLMASAYNGGEGWIMYAKRDLETFNKENGTNYNPNDWEDLRLFYFRSSLSTEQINNFFNQGHRHKLVLKNGKTIITTNTRPSDPRPDNLVDEDGYERGIGNVLTNIAYAETIVPRKGNNMRTLDGLVAIEAGAKFKNIDNTMVARAN